MDWTKEDDNGRIIHRLKTAVGEGSFWQKPVTCRYSALVKFNDGNRHKPSAYSTEEDTEQEAREWVEHLLKTR
jgi:hypothetical protein